VRRTNGPDLDLSSERDDRDKCPPLAGMTYFPGAEAARMMRP
jgi:hypothetical protein